MDKAKQKQFDKIVKYVENAAKSREIAQGKLAVCDFYVGAMASMMAMGFEPPASWVFGIMGNNRKMLGLPKKGKQ